MRWLLNDGPLWTGRGVLNQMRGTSAPAPQLSDFYGIGPGQIPGDWRIDDPVLSGSDVTSVRNDGGAGALFALGRRGTKPYPTREGLYMRTGAGRQLQMANPADLVGTHFMAVLDTTGVTGTKALLSQDGTSQSAYYETRNNLFVIRDPAGNLLATISYPTATGPALFEMRWTGSLVHLILNGTIVNSVTTAATASWPARNVGGGRDDRDDQGFNGLIGRCISVVIAPAKSAADPEQAVLVARQVLAAQYGITLP